MIYVGETARSLAGRLQEMPSGSIYKNSSKFRAKLSLVFFLDIFSSAIMTDLTTTFTSSLIKLDAKCVNQH